MQGKKKKQSDSREACTKNRMKGLERNAFCACRYKRERAITIKEDIRYEEISRVWDEGTC